MEDKILLKMPSQIRLKTEFVEGFGTQELIKTIICGAISGVIAYIIYLIFKQPLISTLIVIGSLVVSFIAFTKITTQVIIFFYTPIFGSVNVILKYRKDF